MLTIPRRAFIYCCLVASVSTLAIGAASQTPVGSKYPSMPSIIMNSSLPVDSHTSMTLSDHRGEVVLVYLSAIWDGPGRRQIPEIVALRNKYWDRGFEVIGLNVGGEDGNYEPYSRLKRFAARNHIDFPLVRSPHAVSIELYRMANLEAVPLAILLDREGKLNAIICGGGPEAMRQMQSAIEKMMGSDPPSDKK